MNTKPQDLAGKLKLLVFGALTLVLVGASSWFLAVREPASKAQNAGLQAPSPPFIPSAAELSRKDAKLGAEPRKVIVLLQRVDQLQDALKTVVADRSSAEEQLRQAERDVAALERYIEEIEERGEDPVDHAEEGLAMFQPAFTAYQEAIEKLELATSVEQTLTAELIATERKVATILVDSDID